MINQFLFRFLFTVVALGILALYVFVPEKLAARFDTMALALVGLAALPWIGALVEEFKIGGVEAKLRAIREEAAEAADAAAEAREVAEELALSKEDPLTGFDDLPTHEFGGTTPAPPTFPDDAEPSAPTSMEPEDDRVILSAENEQTSMQNIVRNPKSPRVHIPYDDPYATEDRPDPDAPDVLSALKKIADAYIETRRTMPSGASRTARMTNIFAEMQGTARKLGGDHQGILDWMRSDDPGEQLAAIAWLRNYPAAVSPATYISLIGRANQPFVQYWGLRALSGRISALGQEGFSIADRKNLQEFETLVQAGTDRHAQIRRINRKLQGRVPAD